MIDRSKFQNDSEFFKFLKDNKSQLVSQKKFEMKKADAVVFIVHSVNEKDEAEKAADNVQYLLSKDKIKVRVVINTTKLLDSHQDVHIDGLWKKSLKELKSVYHLQEHQMKFDHVISDEVRALTKKMSWKELNIDLPGETEA
jgi:predicted GTPase